MQQGSNGSFIPAEVLMNQLAAERERLRRAAGLTAPNQFRRPVERPFLAHERDKVTILFGGLTWKHEALIKAVFEGNGYRCATLPNPVVAAFKAPTGLGSVAQR